MARSYNPGLFVAGAALLALSFGSVAPAAAQATSRMRVLIPAFTTAEGKTTKDGEKIAEQLRKHINTMATHAPVDDKLIKDGLKRLQVKEADLTDCLKWRQFASSPAARVEAGLVLCGTIDAASGAVTANFHPIGGADAFDVPTFTMTSPDQAAQQVVAAFGQYVRGLQLAVSCNDKMQNQSWQQALDDCNQALEINPKSFTAMYSRGSALLKLERPEEALATYQKVLELDPFSQDALQAAGYTANLIGQRDVAIEYFKRYLEFNPGNEDIRLTIANRLMTDGDPAAALSLIEDATAKPEATVSMYTYAGHYAISAALEEIKKTPAGGEKNPEAARYFQKAIENYEKARTMRAAAGDSVDVAVLRQLMLAYNGVESTAKALEIGKLTTDMYPGDAATWNMYSEVLRGKEDWAGALAALERAGAIDPATAQLNLRRGMLLLSLDRMRDGVAAMKTAIAANEVPAQQAEQFAQLLASKGYALVSGTNKNFSGAVEHFEAAREIAKSEQTNALINYLHGVTLVFEVDPIVRGETKAAGQRARPMVERAKLMLQSASAHTESASQRAQMLTQIATYLERADWLIKNGK